MTQSNTSRRWEPAVWAAALGLFLVKSLWVLLTSVRGLATTTWIIDDTFIIMKVARNIALGNGFSYDSVHHTTGAPFFWTYLTSINHLLFPLNGAVRATFIESALFGALATVAVFFLALKLTQSRPIAWTAFALSAFTGNAFFNGLIGMETTFFTLFVVLTVSTYLNVGRPSDWSDIAWGGVVGVCAGLAAMTRGDGVFIIGTIGLVHLWKIATEPQSRSSHLRLLGGMILTCSVLFAIFMAWQLLSTGSPLPANQVGRRGLSLAFHGFSYDNFSWGRYARIVIWNIFQLEHLMTIALGSSLLAIVGIGAGFLQDRLRLFSAITLVYVVSFFAVLAAYQWYFPDFHGLRYVNPAVHLLCVHIAALLWLLPQHKRKTCIVWILTGIIAILSFYLHYQLSSRMPWAAEQSYIAKPNEQMLEESWGVIDWVEQHTDHDAIIGVRDHGRAALFGNRPVQDLAGNIDPAVRTHLQNGTLDSYLHERGVSYLLIPSLEFRPEALYEYIYSHLPLVQPDGAPSTEKQRIWRIDWEAWEAAQELPSRAEQG